MKIVEGTPDASKPVKQCKSCPWRADVVPSRDVPDYAPGLYGRMRETMRSGLESLTDEERVIMACHHPKPGIICAGWLHHQVGIGNNIAMRIAVSTGRFPRPIVVGKQREHINPDSEE